MSSGRAYPGRRDLLDRLIEYERRLQAVERPRLVGGFDLFRSYPTSEYVTPPQVATSSTFTSLYRIEGRRQHRRLFLKLRVTTSAGTTGTVRLQDNGNDLTLWSYALAADFAEDLIAEIDLPDTTEFGTNFVYEVEAQRLSGTGSVRVSLGLVYGYT